MNLHSGLGSFLRTKYSVIAFLLRGGHTPPPGPFRVKVKFLKLPYSNSPQKYARLLTNAGLGFTPR